MSFILSKNISKFLFQKVYSTKVNKVCFFHSSSRLNVIPPLIWAIFAKPVAKLSSILFGRGFRKWWTALPAGKKHTILFDHMKTHSLRYGSILGGTGLISGIYYQTHVEKTPITNRKRFILFNSSQLRDIEKVGIDEIKAAHRNKIIDLRSAQATTALRVAKRLFDANKSIPEIANIEWKLTVIEDNTINAVAFPNGDVFVFTGLIKFAENDDELATILAHEMSHAILQHAAEEMSHKRIIDIIFITLAGLVWSILPTDITAFLTQMFVERFRSVMFDYPYSRNIEKEADTVGFMLAARACFDIRQSSEFWKRMSLMDENIPEVLSTHPTSESRYQDFKELIPTGLLLRKQCNCDELKN